MKSSLDLWLEEGRPEKVRVLARKYPPGTKFRLHDGVVYHIVGYHENGALLVSTTNPYENYQQAVATRHPICACCVGKIDELRIRPCFITEES